ncbi:MAG: methionine--tRNA ligase [Proteobacteria bacterium]|nr:methionine--tRNA ligase [Pseudomonadota bacterium]
MSNKFYITTPIYYVNDYPHSGHAYTTVAAEVMARYHRLTGKEVYFLTGTDEHGQKIEKTAKQTNETPIGLADRVVQRFKTLWEKLNISHDQFIRTTDRSHIFGALHFFQKCFENGDIYLGDYEGWYAVNDEEFLTDTQVQELGDAIHNNPNIVRLKEKTYFFKLSKFQDQLLKHIQDNKDFIQPESRRNEVIKFIERGLKDLSISRTSFQWGIPLPQDPKHVMYVWFDALSNYITAIGYGKDQATMDKWWPADIHLVGKDILRFHCIFWPAFLMSAGVPLPKTVYAHGWWTIEGEKMSKSKGNFVDPFEFVEKFGADPFRYFLLREFPFGQDGNFSAEQFRLRLNNDLANELGNLVSRTISMVGKYCEGKVPSTPSSSKLIEDSLVHAKQYEDAISKMAFEQALNEVSQILRKTNQSIDTAAPWKMAKDEALKSQLEQHLYEWMEAIRITSVLLYPFMPTLTGEIRKKLGLPIIVETKGKNAIQDEMRFGILKAGTAVAVGAPLFTRIEG